MLIRSITGHVDTDGLRAPGGGGQRGGHHEHHRAARDAAEVVGHACAGVAAAGREQLGQ